MPFSFVPMQVRPLKEALAFNGDQHLCKCPPKQLKRFSLKNARQVRMEVSATIAVVSENAETESVTKEPVEITLNPTVVSNASLLVANCLTSDLE